MKLNLLPDFEKLVFKAKPTIHTGKKISNRLPYLPYKMTTFRTVKKLVKNDAKLTIFVESIKIC